MFWTSVTVLLLYTALVSVFILLCRCQASEFLQSMERKLPVLLARAVVASSTSQNDSADNTFKDKIRFAEPGVADVANKACEIHITITIKVQKSNDLTVSQSHISRQKKDSSSESDDSHADDAPKKKQKRWSSNSTFPLCVFGWSKRRPFSRRISNYSNQSLRWDHRRRDMRQCCKWGIYENALDVKRVPVDQRGKICICSVLSTMIAKPTQLRVKTCIVVM